MSAKSDDKVAISCTVCKAASEVSRTTTVGAQERESGFAALMRLDTTFVWLCPSCRDEVAVHVAALLKLLKDPHIFWGGLPHIVTKAKT